MRVYYEMLGVNSREIEMISRAMPKREYYQRTPNGRRLFNIGFGPVALAFVGVSGPEVRARIGEIRKTHGAEMGLGVAACARCRQLGGLLRYQIWSEEVRPQTCVVKGRNA